MGIAAAAWTGSDFDSDVLAALAAWAGGEVVDATGDPLPAPESWLVEDRPPSIDDFLLLAGDAFLFQAEGPTPDSGRVPDDAPDTPSTSDTAADSAGEAALPPDEDDADDGGSFSDQPGESFDFVPAEAAGNGEPDPVQPLANEPSADGVFADSGRPVDPAPSPELPADTAPADDDTPGVDPGTTPADDGTVLDLAQLGDAFDFLL